MAWEGQFVAPKGNFHLAWFWWINLRKSRNSSPTKDFLTFSIWKQRFSRNCTNPVALQSAFPTSCLKWSRKAFLQPWPGRESKITDKGSPLLVNYERHVPLVDLFLHDDAFGDLKFWTCVLDWPQQGVHVFKYYFLHNMAHLRCLKKCHKIEGIFQLTLAEDGKNNDI